jgi:hypothetical protein
VSQDHSRLLCAAGAIIVGGMSHDLAFTHHCPRAIALSLHWPAQSHLIRIVCSYPCGSQLSLTMARSQMVLRVHMYERSQSQGSGTVRTWSCEGRPACPCVCGGHEPLAQAQCSCDKQIVWSTGAVPFLCHHGLHRALCHAYATVR